MFGAPLPVVMAGPVCGCSLLGSRGPQDLEHGTEPVPRVTAADGLLRACVQELRQGRVHALRPARVYQVLDRHRLHPERRLVVRVRPSSTWPVRLGLTASLDFMCESME